MYGYVCCFFIANEKKTDEAVLDSVCVWVTSLTCAGNQQISERQTQRCVMEEERAQCETLWQRWRCHQVACCKPWRYSKFTNTESETTPYSLIIIIMIVIIATLCFDDSFAKAWPSVKALWSSHLIMVLSVGFISLMCLFKVNLWNFLPTKWG